MYCYLKNSIIFDLSITTKTNFMKMFQVESAEIGVVFEDYLTLEEANEYVSSSEQRDRDNAEYTPDFYLIKEMED